MKRFHVIFAMDSQFGIGRQGELPWAHNAADMAFFRDVTTRKRLGEYPVKRNVVIMGRRTWESLPPQYQPLPFRTNVVVTQDSTYTTINSVDVRHDLDGAITQYLNDEDCGDVFVIGGGQIYNQCLTDPRLGEVFITEISGEYNCDTFIDRELLKPYKFRTAEILEETTTPLGQPVKFCRMETFQHADYVYGQLLHRLLLQGESVSGRNGGTSRICGDVQLAFSLAHGIPVLTGKKVLWKPVVEELLFFIRGETDSKIMEARGARFWRWNTNREFLDSRGLTDYPEGEMGPMYGYQWRHFNGDYSPGTPPSGGYDQLAGLVEELQSNRTSRRLLMTTFNPTAVNASVLWPCHGLVVQFFVDSEDGLSCKMYQRSADTFLGLPFNMASYALLVCILARICGYTPRNLFITIGDCHLYDNHFEQAREYLSRAPYASPQLQISESIQTLADVEASTAEAYTLLNYQHHPFIRAEMSA